MTQKTRLNHLESDFNVKVLTPTATQLAERIRELLTVDECRALSERLHTDGLAAFDDMPDIRAKIMADPAGAELLQRFNTWRRYDNRNPIKEAGS